MATYIKQLKEICKDDLSIAGGKGANLGEMIKAGLPVPGGFVLLTSAYRRFTEANKLNEQIEALVSVLTDYEDMDMLQRISQDIKKLCMEAPLPDDIRKEIARAYEDMGSGRTAVRSSATAEDLPGTSFAGQYDTFLHISGIESLLVHIRKCWASLWNARALAYRLKHRIDVDLAHGVVVQAMVSSEKSGILFTADPITGRRDRMLLNASWGLGEAVVSGEVSPDQWLIDRKTASITQHTTSKKTVMTVQAEQGITLTEVPEDIQQKKTLSDREVLDLLRLGEVVEEHFRSPQDIEWAWEAGTWYVVQTRPITSLYPMPESVEGREGLRVHINFSVISQGMYDPLTPMGESIFLQSMLLPVRKLDPSVKDERDIWWYKSIGGRMFIDYTELVRTKKKWKSMVYNDLFSDQDPLAADALMQVLHRHEEEITSKKNIFTPFMMRKLPKLLSLAWPMVKNTIYGNLFPEKAKIRAIEQWDQIAEKAQRERLLLHTLDEKLQWIEDQVASYMIAGFEILCLIAPSFKNVSRAEKIIAPYVKDLSILSKVDKSLPGNSTTEMGVELMEIAKKLDREGKTPTRDTKEIKDFLSRYGHRSSVEMDIGIPRWCEEPQFIVDLIQSHIDAKTYMQGLESYNRGIREAEEVIEMITAALQNSGAHGKARKVKTLLSNFRSIFGLREHSKFALLQVYHEVREVLKSIGYQLAEEKRIEDPMDVFFLRTHELKQQGPLKAVVHANKQEFEKNKQLNTPRILLSTGECIYGPAADDAADALAGFPVSAGIYEGTVRVLSSPNEGSSLKPGEILVTKSTSPAWTPLFLRIGGLVMETGGPISHGSVVAREYGVPAVAGISDITSKLKDGQKIRVNGETGKVEILSQ